MDELKEDLKILSSFGIKILRTYNLQLDQAPNILKAIKDRKACLMSNHGQVAFGENLSKAFELAQEVENICQQYVIALKMGEPKNLSFAEMKKILEKVKNYKSG